ncbi:MAG TPA: hypothetical protein VMR18_04555 [Candidatus Saccharimonadales bacterium]|jgi:archaellum biogenesis ATPase FlaH|nr:hypothetical protein [Candidatus Saccharimonadales bacterium]
MDSINDILSNKQVSEPPENNAIRKYVKNNFNSSVMVVSQKSTIIITAPSSSLANALRLNTRQLQSAAHTDKKLVFRTGDIG